MNALGIALLSVTLAAGASVLTTYALAPQPAAPPTAVGADDLASLQAEIAALHEELGAMRRERVDELPAATSPSSERLAMGDIDGAVRRYLDERLPAILAEGDVDVKAASAPKTAAESPEDLMALLLDESLDENGRQEIWDRLRANGQLDEMIELFEERARERSDDPEAQVELANAYLQKIFELGDGPEKGVWAMKADGAYDQALALDDRHWKARFSKAISLSFWPPIFGKQKEAISQFELLISQQQEGALEESHAQTYLLLGNLYHQTGQGDKADEIWRAGLGLFPSDETLLEMVGDE